MTEDREDATTDDHHVIAAATTERYGVFDGFEAVDMGETNAVDDHDIKGLGERDKG
ncbi:hypothetical protein [Halorussus lipolyticus]|uniref:hypothetical protein n=1 Tax=Halorussus lipolyticus TaxID=3034024 RepID=UPI0023E8C2D1|nr:hypothetical protein [Halorussus sp. DT80]